MIGGRFQGCTAGPASSCQDIATVPWRPTRDWNVLTVADDTPYRWLRYIGPWNGFTNVAEIEFYTPAATSGRIRVNSSDTVRVGRDHVVTTFTNTGNDRLQDVRLSLDGYAVDDYRHISARPLSPTTIRGVAVGDTFSVEWLIHAKEVPGEFNLIGRAVTRRTQPRHGAWSRCETWPMPR